MRRRARLRARGSAEVGRRAPQVGRRAPQEGSRAPPAGEPGSTPAPQVGSRAPQEGRRGGEPGSTPGSRGARLPFGLPAGTWAPATWPDWLCRICSPEPPYQPSKAHFRPPVGAVRGVNKSGTADTALKTRLPTIYSGAPPLGSRAKFLAERASAPRTHDSSSLQQFEPSSTSHTVWPCM